MHVVNRKNDKGSKKEKMIIVKRLAYVTIVRRWHVILIILIKWGMNWWRKLKVSEVW